MWRAYVFDPRRPPPLKRHASAPSVSRSFEHTNSPSDVSWNRAPTDESVSLGPSVRSTEVSSSRTGIITRHVDFGALPAAEGHPVLLVGAVDVLTGAFKAFDSRRDRISADTLLASAAIPTLFRSVHLDGGVYWDGLFSQNPPVRELVDTRPDEIWVIQINPTRLDAEPRSPVEIADRRNELAGNRSLLVE